MKLSRQKVRALHRVATAHVSEREANAGGRAKVAQRTYVALLKGAAGSDGTSSPSWS